MMMYRRGAVKVKIAKVPSSFGQTIQQNKKPSSKGVKRYNDDKAGWSCCLLTKKRERNIKHITSFLIPTFFPKASRSSDFF